MQKIRTQRTHNLVLVADNDPLVRQLVRRAYMDLAEIIEVAEGDNVLEAYRHHMPNMVLLDLHLPKCAGLALIDPLRRADIQAHIIILSADAAREDILSCKAHGAQGFIAKPCNLDVLLRDFYRCPTVKFNDSCVFPQPATST